MYISYILVCGHKYYLNFKPGNSSRYNVQFEGLTDNGTQHSNVQILRDKISFCSVALRSKEVHIKPL